MEAETLFSGDEGIFELELGEGWVGEKGAEHVGLALAESGNDRRDVQRRLFQVENGRG